MYLSHSDFDKCLKDGSFYDEIIELPLNKMAPEFLMTQVNRKENNWRLCKAIRVKNTDNATFTKRTYLDKIEVDISKYTEYFNKEILPLLKRSNDLIRKQYPDVVFY